MSLIGVLLFLGGMVTAPESIYVLDSNAPVWDVATEDLNQDGVLDVLTVCCAKDRDPLEKYVAVFLGAPSQGYPLSPSSILELNTEVGGLFLAEIDGKAPKELVTVHASGATVYGFEHGKWTPQSNLQFSSLFPTNAREPLFLRDAATDLDGDGIDEWFVPIAGGFQIFYAAKPLVTITCDIESEIRRGENIYIYHRLPTYHTFTVSNASQKAIAFLSDEYADFAYGEQWQQHNRFKIPLRVDEKWDASVRMADVDKNGLPDLIVTQTKGTVNLLALTQVYLAKAPYQYADTPDVTYETKGALASPFLKDVNGDNLDDLVFIKIPLGVRAFMNYFLRRKLTVEVDVHFYKPSGYGAAPDFTQTLTLDAPEGREQVAYTMGDFNGDKRLDVAIGAGTGGMVVYTGVAGKFLNQKPWVTVNIPSFGIARAIDLDKNGKDDIILFHPGVANKNKIEIVLF